MSQDTVPSPQSKLLALLDQAVASNELPDELEEVIELEPVAQVAKLCELAGDRLLAPSFHAVAILALNRLPFNVTMGQEDISQTLSKVLEPLLQDSMTPACVRAAAANVLLGNDPFADPPETDETEQQQAVFREGVLQNDSPLVAASSVDLLSPESTSALLPNLIQFMQLGENPVAKAALECLEKIGTGADAAIPAHLKILQQPAGGSANRYQLLRNLGRIGTRFESTIPVLLQVINTPESEDFGAAINSLMQVISHNDLDATEYMPLLEKFLREKTDLDLRNLLGAIASLGVKARPIRPLVKALDRHPDQSIVRLAREALRAMRLPKPNPAAD